MKMSNLSSFCILFSAALMIITVVFIFLQFWFYALSAALTLLVFMSFRVLVIAEVIYTSKFQKKK